MLTPIEIFILFLCVLVIALTTLVGVPGSIITDFKQGSHESTRQKYIIVEDTKYIFDETRKRLSGFTFMLPGDFLKLRPRPDASHVWVFGAGLSSRATEQIHAKYKSRLNCLDVADKVRLHALLQADPEMADLIAPTVEITADDIMPDGTLREGLALPCRKLAGEKASFSVDAAGPWIMRANWGWKGAASGVAVDKQGIVEWYKKLSHRPNDIGGRPRGIPRIIASDYIQDPLMYQGYKFHVRLYVVAYVIGRVNPERGAILCKTMFVVPGGVKWHAGDWGNESMHDSHWDRNEGIIKVIGEGVPDHEIMTDRVIELMRKVFCQGGPVLESLKLYPECDAACEVFGLDVMLRRDFTPVLIEVNDRPGVEADDIGHGMDVWEIINAIPYAAEKIFPRELFSASPSLTPDRHVIL